MIKRSVCIYNGKPIGIESIYTVIDGKQINIPEKLKWLSSKSKNHELFCPCGCRANLTLVAGQKMLRAQHFRINDAAAETECTYVEETQESLDSKVLLHCWLDKNLRTDDIETRVPICRIGNSMRKYEFSFLSESRKVAISYAHDSASWTDEKFSILRENSNGVRLFCITDWNEHNCTGQYPEPLMRMQEQQGYCLFLDQENADYKGAKLNVIWHGKNCDGFWTEVQVICDELDAYAIANNGDLLHKGKSVADTVASAKTYFEKRQKEIPKERAEAARKIREENERLRQLYIERQKRERQRREVEEAAYQAKLADRLATSKRVVTDRHGNRVYLCKDCQQIRREIAMAVRGTGNNPNLGICKSCKEKENAETRQAAAKALVESILKDGIPKREKREPLKCPRCGEKLQEKVGRYGRFVGCSNYPACRYTEKV